MDGALAASSCESHPQAGKNLPLLSGEHAPDHSGLMPANLMTLPHFCVSSAIKFPKSAAEPGSNDAPRSVNRAFATGSANIALIAVLSLSTISAGVPLGATRPYQALAS